MVMPLPGSAFVQTNAIDLYANSTTNLFTTNSLTGSGSSAGYLNVTWTWNPNFSLADVANGGNHFTGAYTNANKMIEVFDNDANDNLNQNNGNDWFVMTNGPTLDADLNNSYTNVILQVNSGLANPVPTNAAAHMMIS